MVKLEQQHRRIQSACKQAVTDFSFFILLCPLDLRQSPNANADVRAMSGVIGLTLRDTLFNTGPGPVGDSKTIMATDWKAVRTVEQKSFFCVCGCECGCTHAFVCLYAFVCVSV